MWPILSWNGVSWLVSGVLMTCGRLGDARTTHLHYPSTPRQGAPWWARNYLRMCLAWVRCARLVRSNATLDPSATTPSGWRRCQPWHHHNLPATPLDRVCKLIWLQCYRDHLDSCVTMNAVHSRNLAVVFSLVCAVLELLAWHFPLVTLLSPTWGCVSVPIFNLFLYRINPLFVNYCDLYTSSLMKNALINVDAIIQHNLSIWVCAESSILVRVIKRCVAATQCHLDEYPTCHDCVRDCQQQWSA